MAVDEKVSYCQVDAHLDSNPKIRRAGNAGRQVFEFLLRRVAIGNTQGTVPLKYIEPWYLADQLMMTGESREVTAGDGVSSAVTAQLISIDQVAGVVRIVGWSPEWGRRPKTGAERQAAYKERNAPKSDNAVTQSNGESRQVTESDESDVREEKRREEDPLSGKPDTAALFADEVVGEINRLAGTSFDHGSKTAIDCSRKLLKAKFTPSDAIAVIRSKREWLDKADMRQHFCPTTLLGPKNFQRYHDNLQGLRRLPAPKQRGPVEEPDVETSHFALRVAP